MRQLAMCSALFAVAAVGCWATVSPADDPPARPAAGRKVGLAKPTPVPVDLDGQLAGDVIYPFLGDIDGDGTADLLVGTRIKGRLLVYPDARGAGRRPAAQWFDDREPTGRIPAG